MILWLNMLLLFLYKVVWFQDYFTRLNYNILILIIWWYGYMPT